jgi:two-component system, OmpR family, response regulator
MSQTIPAGEQTKKILIIEDEGDICLLLNIILKKDEVDLEHVKTLAAAKAYLAVESPSLVMLDNKLPDGLGIDFIEYIRECHPASKILMISGFHASTAKDVALFNGADAFLEKPFTKEQVHSSVQALLN